MVSNLTNSEQNVIDIVLYVSSSLSILGSLFIILTYLIFKDSRTLGTQLIVFLSLSDLLSSISWLPWNVDEGLCIAQAILLQFGIISSYMWTGTKLDAHLLI